MNSTLGYYLIVVLSVPFMLTSILAPLWSRFVARILPSGVNHGDTFDFIVVGSGSAGSVVAGRLAEAGHQVLLVEAGGPPNWMMSVPALMASPQGTDYDWKYKTVPQKHTMKALADRVSNWPRGRVLGGTSQLNSMLYVRGNPRDYDEWSSFGNNGWAFKDVLPFFKKSENFQDTKNDDFVVEKDYHGKSGPMGVRTIPDVSDLTKVFEESLDEIGVPHGDYNGKNQEVLAIGQTNQDSGYRADTYSSFAEPYVGKGLTVLTYAQATKILFKTNSKEAGGIRVERFGEQLDLFVNKELILSAGAVGSPHLLMLSGIGPKKQLEKVGITTLVDSPGVGSNLQDHIMALYPIKINETLNGKRLGVDSFTMMNPLNYIQFMITGRGPLSDNFLRAGAFVHSEVNQDPWKRADIQMHTYPYPASLDFGVRFRYLFGFSDEGYRAMYGEDNDNADGGFLLPTLLRPKSKGTITLQSSDPMVHPIIDPKYMEDPADIRTMAAGLKYTEKMLASKAFKKRGIQHEPIPQCKEHKTYSQKYYECFCRYYIFTVWHPVGTCKMAPKSDKLAVVDPELRVHGVKNLRVIDASIMPTMVSGNTNAPTIMIGERGVDFILKDHPVQAKKSSSHQEL